MAVHVSVLLKESVDYLAIEPNGKYVDATFGSGGHSREIASRLSQGHVYAFDQDSDASDSFSGAEKITLIRSNFRFLSNFLRYHHALPVNGILADLGISSHHIETPERGFSFRFDAPLDMRMNVLSKKTAHDVVNSYSVEELTRIFRQYGEIAKAFNLAKAIEKQRMHKSVNTTFELAGIAQNFTQKNKENSFLAQVFQAIRIEVNQELEVLEQFLNQAYECLIPGGRLVVISYHSLEDRMIKNFFKSVLPSDSFSENIMGTRNFRWNNITSGADTPTEAEIIQNPRSRSAKLRAAEKI